MKQWKRLAALSSAIVMAAATLTYFPNDTLQNIRWEISASADETSAVTWTKTESDGLTWTLDADGTLTISGTGAMKDYDYDSNPSPVCNNSNVKKVVIKDGVTSIGNSVFDSCSNLASITIPDGVTSIGYYAFSDCRRLTSITIPDGVTSIGVSAFYNCSNLTSITIPDSVTSIGAYAFSGCEGLTSITIPDSVTSIGNSAFYNCSSLTSITIPKSVTSIELAAFYNCSSLTSITIPDSVTSIGRSAFYKCSSLTSITIPDSVTSIGETVFGDCSNLTTISLSCKSTLKKSNFGGQANLVSASHTLKKTAAKAATCAEDGNIEYWTCEHCGKYFLSDDTNPETAKAVELSETVIPASHKLTKVEAKAVTCTEDGNKEYWTCEHCGKYFLSDDTNPETAKAVELSETILPAIQHKNAELLNASEPTETAPGYSGDRYCPDCDTVLEKGYTYWKEGNLTWKLDADGTLTISGTGAMKDYDYDDNPSPAYNNSKVKKVVIEKGVTTIGEYAFCNCTSLTDITIPDSITSIEDFAFEGCISLTSITIPDGVTSIGAAAFQSCSSLTSITIPDSVTSIGSSVFWYCSSLTSITIPDSVTSIGNGTFSHTGLKSITLPDSVTSIGDVAFSYTGLKSITIPDSVTSIGETAFNGCSSLQTISLSCKSSLKKSDFGEQADLVSYTNQHLLTKTAAKAATCTESGNKEYWTCKYCGKYFLSDDTNPATATAVELSETVIPALNHKNAITRGASEPTETEPGYSGDRYCPDCDTVFEKGYTYWNEDNLTWKLDADGTLTISGTGAMKDYDYDNNQSPVYNNSNVKKVVIEDGVTSIGNWAFESCNSLTSITIPNSVTSIGASAFSNCYYLTNITIPNSVTSIENYAFKNCSSLTSITIPDSVTSIGELAFYDCDRLTSITISNNVTSIGERAFAYCSRLTSITIPDSVTSIGEAAFAGCSSLTSITIPDSVTSIGEYAFQSCSSLTSITIPDSVTSIGWYAFSNCESLTSITIPDSVTSIGSRAFSECYILKTISLSCKSSLKRSDFGKQADLVSYTSYTLKKTEAKTATCTEDGNKEYWTCEHCGKYFLSDDTNPETAKAVEQSECMIPAIQHKNAIIQNASEPTETAPGYSGDLYCPDCDKVVEKGYTYWIEDNLTWKLYEDGTLNISGAGAMKDYDYDNNPSPASQKKDSVKKVVIEDGVTSIGNSAFDSCSNLTSITIPDSVSSIGNFVFYGCVSLTSITIPNSVISIGNYAFYNCRSLTSITIPNSVTSIEPYAFYNCSSLTSITIPNSVTSIEPYAFYNCRSLTSITIPNSVTSIGNFAFSDCRSLTSITILDSVTSIGNYAFAYCEGLTSITIPDSVTSIGAYAFSYCSSLTSITIPDSVTSIGNGAFDNCSSLTSITISDRVTSIENFAFSKCSSLTNIKIPDSVTSIGSSAFNGCSSLQTISLSCKSSLKKSDFGDQADLVSYTSHTLKKTEAKDATCTEDGNKEYWTCEHCGKYFLSDDTNPETAKAVEQSETVIPASHKLTKVEAKDATCAEDGNKEYWTCEHCGKYFLSDDTNPETAKAVELSETILPALKHKNAIVLNASEPTETAPGYSGDRYCPDCDKVVEKGYTYWNEGNLTWKLDADGTLTISGTGAMKDYDNGDNLSPVCNNSNVKKVVIEDGVTSIGDYAFSDCSGLISITIPNSVASIGDWAFYYCISLTTITIPDSVTSIGNSTFSGCWDLTSITIPDSVTSIGNSAFSSCISLTSITIPDSVTSIGSRAFSECHILKTISLSCKSSLKKSNFGGQANLVSYTSHTLKKTEAKAATCFEDGNKAYWTCEHCKKYFLSDDTNPETAKAVELSETVIPALVQIATTTTPIKCVYGQDMNKIDLRDYVKNTDVVGEVTVKVATGSTLPDGMKLDGSNLSGKPAKAYEDGKEVTFTFTAENGSTANLTLLFLVAKADPTVEVAVNGDSHTEGDLVGELELILSENSTKGVVELVSEIKALVAGKNTLTWKFTPEDENNYHTVTGTVVVNAQTTTTTTITTKATTTTTKATTTTKPSKTTTTKVTTTTKPSKTTTTNATTTTKPSKTTTTKATTTTNATTTTKPSKTTTTKATTTTKPSKTTTTKVTTTTKPNKTTTTKVTTTTKPSKTTTTNATTTNTAIPSYGDVNLDGKVDIVDAIFLNKYLATLIQFSDAQMANADCCQDGVLNDQDTTALMQFIILLIDDLPVQPTEK